MKSQICPASVFIVKLIVAVVCDVTGMLGVAFGSGGAVVVLSKKQSRISVTSALSTVLL